MILGTRRSLLARGQTAWVRERLAAAHPPLELKILEIRTSGDRLQSDSSEAVLGASGLASEKGIFITELRAALRDRRIHAAVHSLKDLPTEPARDLTIACVPVREDARDVLVTRDGAGLDELRPGSRLGTGSLRRAAQLLARRSDVAIVPIRGNVDTRIQRMLDGNLDGVILAAAGLRRIGWMDDDGRSTRAGVAMCTLSEDICLPAVGQGALGIEVRADDGETRERLTVLHDERTAAEVQAERSFLDALGGGCRVPIAARARVDPDAGQLSLRGLVATPDGSRILRVGGKASSADPERLGRELACQALNQGAKAILGIPES